MVVFARLTAVVLALAGEIQRPIKLSFPRDLLIQFGREALGKVFSLEQVMLDEALAGRPVVGVQGKADLQVGSWAVQEKFGICLLNQWFLTFFPAIPHFLFRIVSRA